MQLVAWQKKTKKMDSRFRGNDKEKSMGKSVGHATCCMAKKQKNGFPLSRE